MAQPCLVFYIQFNTFVLRAAYENVIYRGILMLNKNKYNVREEEEQTFDIPEWHKAIIDQRLAAYKANPTDVIDFDKVCDDIEKEL
jgi:hypothetical protein